MKECTVIDWIRKAKSENELKLGRDTKSKKNNNNNNSGSCIVKD